MVGKINTSNSNGEQLVWYVSYGSNMHRNRFLCYIIGGQPEGSNHRDPGCNDKTLPLDEMSIEIPHGLYFAGESRKWTGGIAFINRHKGSEYTKGRAYLIGASQFEEIVVQEGNRSVDFQLNVDLLRRSGGHTIGRGSYDALVYLGERDGVPMVTFTSPQLRGSHNRPSAAYIRTIAVGLIQTHQMTPAGVTDYLLTKPGVMGNYTYAELLKLVADQEPSAIIKQSKPRINIDRID